MERVYLFWTKLYFLVRVAYFLLQVTLPPRQTFSYPKEKMRDFSDSMEGFFEAIFILQRTYFPILPI